MLAEQHALSGAQARRLARALDPLSVATAKVCGRRRGEAAPRQQTGAAAGTYVRHSPLEDARTVLSSRSPRCAETLQWR
jgi:hypothetical protein